MIFIVQNNDIHKVKQQKPPASCIQKNFRVSLGVAYETPKFGVATSVADAGFQKGELRKEVRAEILATPPQQQPQSMRILMLLQQFFDKITCC